MPAYVLKVRGGKDTYTKRDGSTGTAGKGALMEEEVAFTLAATQDMTLVQQIGADNDAEAEETGGNEVLPCMRETDASQGLEGRRIGEQPALPQEEVLRQEVHGCGVRDDAEEGEPFMDDRPLPRAEHLPSVSMRDVRKDGENGRASYQRGLDGQQGGEPGSSVQELSLESTSSVENYIVRRLTPLEAERLQGFPDGWTDIPWKGQEHAPDTPRYKALGNSMAVPVMRWLFERMEMVDDLMGDA